MLRLLIIILLTLGSAFSTNAQEMRPFNDVSILALVITTGGETSVSASITQTLESLNAQVLTTNAPDAPHMRSILKRFARAASDVEIALVYYDGAVFKIGDREFVAPRGITLSRRSDLLTKAIPLSALARATALAGNSGAVLVLARNPDEEVIDGITLVESAPGARAGISPILFANASAAANLADGLDAMMETDGDIKLNDVLQGLAELDGVSISQLPANSAMLRLYPAPEVASPESESSAEPADVTEPDSTGLPQVGDATPEAVSAAQVAEAVGALTNDAQQPEELPEETLEPPMETTNTDSEEMSSESMPDATAQDTEADQAADSELSIDTLKAMQDALSPEQKQTLQQHLQEMGFYHGSIDGSIGPQTARAISAYQESIGARITGVITPAQMKALGL